MDQLTPLNIVNVTKRREHSLQGSWCCVPPLDIQHCIFPHQRYSSPKIEPESDRVSRFHCQLIGSTVNKMEQVTRHTRMQLAPSRLREADKLRRKRREMELNRLKEASETQQSDAARRPCLGPDLNKPSVKKIMRQLGRS